MEFKRDKYLNQLIAAKDNGFVKIITGMRRVGKSYLLFNIYYKYLISLGIDQEQIIRISLDNFENQKFWKLDNLYDFLNNKINENKNKKIYIFIDEIQFVKPKINHETKEEVTFYHLLISLMKKADIYITGSNSRMLSKDILSEFRGRGQQIVVYPLSFIEFNQYNNDNLSLKQQFNRFIRYGSLPQIALMQNEKIKADNLKNIFIAIYIKDVIERYNLKNDETIINTFIKIISSNIGSLTNGTNIANTFNSLIKTKIAPITINQYLEHFQDSFVIYQAQRYDIKGNKFINHPNKYYFSDLGIRNAIIDFNNISEPKLLENCIYNELRFRGYYINIGTLTKYTKNALNKTQRIDYEIDFMVKKGAKIIYIQVVNSINSQQKLDQEIRGLKEIKDQFKKIIIINDEFESYYDDYGIEHYSIYDFLLTDKWE